jgi:hypothetical protein
MRSEASVRGKQDAWAREVAAARTGKYMHLVL